LKFLKIWFPLETFNPFGAAVISGNGLGQISVKGIEYLANIATANHGVALRLEEIASSQYHRPF
jgi:hypothetical protein